MEEKLESSGNANSSEINSTESNNIESNINDRILDMTDRELIELGIVSGLDNDLYHKASGLSCTNLKIMLRSPAHYHASILFPQKTTAEMQLGSALHTAVLQPDLFDEEYMELPKLDRRTKEGKELYKQYSESGKILLDSATVSTVQKMKESLMQHTIISSVLSSGSPELSCFGCLPEFPHTLIKCRPDWYNEKLGVLLDLKTACDASPKAFIKACVDYLYHLQHALYLDLFSHVSGRRIQAFLFAAVEKEPPYAVAIYELNAEAVEMGRELYRKAILAYNDSLDRHYWVGYSPKIEILQLPAWALVS